MGFYFIIFPKPTANRPFYPVFSSNHTHPKKQTKTAFFPTVVGVRAKLEFWVQAKLEFTRAGVRAKLEFSKRVFGSVCEEDDR